MPFPQFVYNLPWNVRYFLLPKGFTHHPLLGLAKGVLHLGHLVLQSLGLSTLLLLPALGLLQLQIQAVVLLLCHLELSLEEVERR